MANWYYVIPKTREKCGPYEETVVRGKYIAGEIGPTSLVWHDGLAGWIPAQEAFAALQDPQEAGKAPLPDGLRAWMTFVGVMTLIVFFPAAMMLYGMPMWLVGFAILSARSALDRTPFIDSDILPFFSRLKTLFCCWGWMYIIGLFLSVLLLLAYFALAFWFLAAEQGSPPVFFSP